MKGGNVKKKPKEGGVLKKKLKEGGVLKKKLKEGGVLNKKLKEGRVLNKKLKEGRVLNKKLKEGRVLNKKLKEGRVLNKKLKEGRVLNKKLKEGGNLKKKLKDSQGSITFEKILHATSLPAFGSRSNLTLPARFIKEHSDQIRQSVVLRSAETKKKWTVQLGIYYPRNVAQVKFYGGWRDFAFFNGLDEGDLLVFCLRAVSQFDVYIYRKDRNPNAAPSLQDSEPPRKKIITFRPYKNKHLNAEGSDTSLTELLANEIPVEEEVTDYDSDPNSPYNSSEDAAPIQNQKDLPCFIKTIGVSNLHDAAGYESGACLEIPRRFVTTHNMQLRKSVTLQGFVEGSAVHVVSCIFSVQRKQTRLYLRSGWNTFVKDNNLRIGQTLVFTLTGYSFFVVKEAPAS